MSSRMTTGRATVLALLALVPAAAGKDTPSERPGPAVAPDQLAFDLYARLRGRDGNVVFSPQSLSTGLALAQSGARGETARQMAAVLHLPADRPARQPVAPFVGPPPPPGSPSGTQLQMANAMWGQRGYRFLPTYRQALKDRFGAELIEVDFERSPAQACKAVNTWAEEQTQGKVKDLLRPEAVDARTRLVLTNAVYLKAAWASPFRKDRTTDGAFRVGKGRTVTAPFMTQEGTFPYAEDDALQILELPYTGGDLSFVVLLPRAADGLVRVEEKLSAGRVADLVGRLRPRRLDVTLPRFRLSAAVELKRPLAELGMPLAFDPRKADFSGMSDTGEPLSLASVVHSAAVAVDEDGTEAAAATAAVVKSRSVGDASPLVVRADHPFVFLVRDRRSGQVLFLGRLVNPTK